MGKKISLVLVVVFILSVFSGCGGSKPAVSESKAPQPASSQVSAAQQNAKQEPTGKTVKKPDNYPTKPVEFIVPAAAGAAIDVPARALAEVLDLGKPVVVVNKPGASQTIGTAEAVTKKPDGYTLVFGANGNFMIQPSIAKLTYKPEDFRHISMITPTDPIILVVNPNSPIKTFKDFEAKVKAGEALKFSAANPGSVGHLGIESLLKKMGAKNTKFVPFTGSAEGLTALLGGHIDFFVSDNSEATPRVKSGQLAALAVFSEEKSITLPEVPTLKELGYPGMTFVGYKWISVHKDTPDEIVNWIKQQVDLAIQSEKYQEFLKKTSGGTVKPVTEKELTNTILENGKVYDAILNDLGMKKTN